MDPRERIGAPERGAADRTRAPDDEESGLPAPQWGSGSSLINTARRVGSVLGVALLVSGIGVHTTGLPSELGSVRAGWGLLADAAAVAALIGVGLTVAERVLCHAISVI